MFNNIRIVSGIRPTGILHLGNYYGTIKNWLYLQNNYVCFFFIADLHALTTHYYCNDFIKNNSYRIAADLLASGLNPKKCIFFLQSMIPEHLELYFILSMFTPTSWLSKMPTYKDKIKDNNNLNTYGFLGYPILQAADIIMYNASLVPIGIDQIVHIEFTNKIINKLNNMYIQQNVTSIGYFNESKYLLSKNTCLVGLDNKKMSKSNNNTLNLYESELILKKKINMLKTDINKIYKGNKGNYLNCLVWQFHLLYSTQNIVSWIKKSCVDGSLGCSDCKNCLFYFMNRSHKIIKLKSDYYLSNTDLIDDILKCGKKKASVYAKKTIKIIKKIISI